MRVAGFVRCRVGAAREFAFRRRKSGLERDAFLDGLGFDVQAKLRHRFRRFHAVLELFPVGKKMQDAALEMIVLQICFRTQRLQRGAAVYPHGHQFAYIFACAARRALAQKLQSPAPLLQIRFETKQQRRVFLAEPFQNFQWRAGIGPRHRMTGGNLPTVGKAGFQSRARLPIDHGDFVARLLQIPR